MWTLIRNPSHFHWQRINWNPLETTLTSTNSIEIINLTSLQTAPVSEEGTLIPERSVKFPLYPLTLRWSTKTFPSYISTLKGDQLAPSCRTPLTQRIQWVDQLKPFAGATIFVMISTDNKFRCKLFLLFFSSQDIFLICFSVVSPVSFENVRAKVSVRNKIPRKPQLIKTGDPANL